MTPTARPWSPEQLASLAGTRELEISAPRRQGGFGPWTPIWVVVAQDDVFVRTWHVRDTGWYGSAVRTGRARIRVSGLSMAVTVAKTGAQDAAAVDDAYRSKYGTAGAGSMVSPEAAASTLRLDLA